jgi:hypothetical protein
VSYVILNSRCLKSLNTLSHSVGMNSTCVGFRTFVECGIDKRVDQAFRRTDLITTCKAAWNIGKSHMYLRPQTNTIDTNLFHISISSSTTLLWAYAKHNGWMSNLSSDMFRASGTFSPYAYISFETDDAARTWLLRLQYFLVLTTHRMLQSALDLDHRVS